MRQIRITISCSIRGQLLVAGSPAKAGQVTWDLSGVQNGTYTATVEVNDGNQQKATGSATVTVADCTGCVPPPPPCPTVSVSCPTDVEAGQPITFTPALPVVQKEQHGPITGQSRPVLSPAARERQPLLLTLLVLVVRA